MRKRELREIQKTLTKPKLTVDDFGWEVFMHSLYPRFIELGQARFNELRQVYKTRDLATAEKVAAEFKIDCSLQAEAAYLKRSDELFSFLDPPKRERDDKDLLGAKIGGG